MSYEQIIYDECRRQGMTEAAALACVGNFWCESNCEPFRMQGDFSPYRTASKQYVADVSSGRISPQQFANDQKGFGIYQLTYHTRKSGYLEFWRKSGKALDDAALQVQYAVFEMKRDYPALWQFLTQTKDVFTATSRICREFERPALNNIDARFDAANSKKNEIDLNSWQGDVEPEPAPEPKPKPKEDHSLKLRVTDEHCSGWAEAYLVQAILKCRGYRLPVVDGIWDDEDIEAVKRFQRENKLVADGIVGNMTWAKLLER